MPKEEIVEGLKIALQKGQSLKSAMMSFFNSGYVREEIEEAARAVQSTQAIPSALFKPEEIPTPNMQETRDFKKLSGTKEIFHKEKSEMSSSEKMQIPEASVQKISSYGTQSAFQPTKKPKSKFIVFFLVFLLVFFVSLLITIFVFKDDLISLLANLSG